MLVNRMSSVVPESIAQLDQILLKNRGITDAARFFQPPLPSELSVVETGLEIAALEAVAQRLRQSAANSESVVIYGDYDADGVCATAILWEALFSLGIRAQPFIPDRFNHGYGLSVGGVDEVVKTHRPDLIISVDNGIVAYEALEHAKKLGIFTIVTDHHQPDTKPLPADLVLHTTKLSGSGVAWMLANHMAPKAAEISLELAGLATIADQVPLVGANRSVAFHGLRALRVSKRVGLKALFTQAKIDQGTITEKTVGFAIAPRINAMGRLASAVDALRLLCTTSKVRAQNLSQLLEDTNRQRQSLTTDLVVTAKKQAELQKSASVLVVHSESFHEGVIGLIAGKLCEEYHKPAIVIATTGELGKGSARSTPELNMVELLRSVREHLLEMGGHPMAAGFNIRSDKIEEFTVALEAAATKRLQEAPVVVAVAVECLLPNALVTLETAQHLEQFAPFGVGNSQPVFEIQGARVVDTRLVGKLQSHRSYTFGINGTAIRGMSWYQSELLAAVDTNATIIASLGVETWRDVSLLLSVQALKPNEN